MASPSYKPTQRGVSGSFLVNFDWCNCNCISITYMTTKNSNIIFIGQEEWTHKYSKAFRSLRGQRERQFVRLLSGEGKYVQEFKVYESLWEKTEHLCAKLSPNIAVYKEMLQKEWVGQNRIIRIMREEGRMHVDRFTREVRPLSD